MTSSEQHTLNSNMSDMEKITVRDARKEDAADIARLIVLAWPMEEFLAMQEGLTLEDFTKVIQSFVEDSTTLYGYNFTKVAVLSSPGAEDRIVGAMNGYDGAMYHTLKKPVSDALKSRFASGGDFDKVEETGPGEFYLDSAAVDPSLRSRGIGSMLFDAMMQRAAGSGFRTVGLIVDEDKPKAEALYLRLGFSTVGYRDFLGHRMKHMQKNI